MALCHECGSEVAENDIFCPFCGISLEPISLGGAETAAEFENTVIMSLPFKSVEGLKKRPAPKKEKLPLESEDAGSETGEMPSSDEPGDGREAPIPELLMHADSIEIESPVGVLEKSKLEVTKPEEYIEQDDLSDEGHEPQNESIDVVPADDVRTDSQESLALLDNIEAGVDIIGGSDDAPAQAAIEEPHSEPADSEDGVGIFFESNDDLPVVGPDAPDAPAENTISANDDEISADDKTQQNQNLSPEPADELFDSAFHVQEPDKEKSALSETDEHEPELPASVDFLGARNTEETPVDADVEDDKAADDRIKLAVDSSDEPTAFESAEKGKVITNDFEKQPPIEDVKAVSVPNSNTTPNIGGTGTDGKKSGLKSLSEGTVLNARYEIVRKIGGGGMGAVYLAFDKNLGGVDRAVKEMVQSHIEEAQQQKAIDDFKRESMILSTLDHPSIPTIYDYFYDAVESRFYLVMKYISGGDLASRLRATPGARIDEMTVTEWALQIIDVLAYLHGLPTTIVYRDLKPSNVMIDGNSGRIMLIDFGIARSINQTQEKGVTAVGTMGYAPPELFSGNVEPRSDIYSLGSTMFHLLTGADPQNNPLLIFDFQKNPRPRQINPQLSDQMERILMRSVEYSAEARFSTASEMRHVLGDHLENLKRGNITFGVTEIPDAVSLANQSVFCGFCGQRIVATDLFCAFCGAKQPIAQQGVHSEIYARSAPTAKLVIDGTSELDTPAFSLEKNDNLVGRRDPMSNIFPEVDLSKYDPQTKISRRHARIWRDGGNFMVEDLGSSNGTVLLPGISDSVRLMPHTPHALANGDRIRVGDTTLHFLVG